MAEGGLRIKRMKKKESRSKLCTSTSASRKKRNKKGETSSAMKANYHREKRRECSTVM
jgi:hypothetical protein